MQYNPQLPIGSNGRVSRCVLGRINHSTSSRLSQNDLGIQSLPSFASLVAPLDARHAETNQPRQHAAVNVRQSPPFERPLRSLVGHNIIASLETSPLQTPCRSHAIDNDRFSTKAVTTDACGVIPDRGGCEQPPDSHADKASSDQSTGRKRRRRSSSPPSPEHHKTQRAKIDREQRSRSNQTTCFQHMEDFLECVLTWEAPKRQAQGNVTKSGLVSDKQQTMEAFYILSEVLVRHTVSPLGSKPGETPIQTVVRKAKHQIEAHLRDNSAVVLPTCSLMADEASFDDQLCTSTPDHDSCMLDKTSACIKCRKQRRGTVFKRNLEILVAKHIGASSAVSGSSIRRDERM